MKIQKLVLINVIIVILAVMLSACSNDTKINSKSQNIKLPSFKGTVSTSESSPIILSDKDWETAKAKFAKSNNALADVVEQLNRDVFDLKQSVEGTLYGKKFQLDIRQFSDFILVVSKYGEKIKANIDLFPLKQPFVFYNEKVRLQVLSKGIGLTYNIVTGEYEDDYSNEVFDEILSSLHEKKLSEKDIGRELEVGGNQIKLIKQHVIVVK